MSRKRKSVTAWAVFAPNSEVVVARPCRGDAVFEAALNGWSDWETLKKRGYTVRKVTITEAR